MGLTERHWFENEEPELTDRQLEDIVYENKIAYDNAHSAEQRWISVSERLPKDGEDVLVYWNNGREHRIIPTNYDDGVWFDCIFDNVMDDKNITHWMPLPEPPKEGR